MNQNPSREVDWLIRETKSLPVSLEPLRPSEWGDTRRRLTDTVAKNAGCFDYEMTPYLREIVDCLDVRSPVRHVTLMKGAQLGATTGIGENFLGYLIEHVKTSPSMWLTADSDMAKDRMVGHLTLMIQQSGLEHLIRSSDERNTRKTGKTDVRVEWEGGGYVVVLGVRNPNKLRSTPVRFLLRDEIDGWPDSIGKDGDPLGLSEARTAAFEATRKILDMSTPLIKGQSSIETLFLEGDQSHYQVLCLKCGRAQRLKWERIDSNGVKTGFVWDAPRGVLDVGSVRYLCKFCCHPHTEDDKVKLVSPLYGAHWKPHAVAADPYHRSFHMPALCSRLQSWAACVRTYLRGWDEKAGHPKDNRAYQFFYNTVLGSTYELRGERVRFENVSEHRRHAYKYGQIPNRWALEHCGSRVLAVVRTVDVHADNLAVAVFGWCRDRRVILISYERFEGDTEQLDNPATWERLRADISGASYPSDDGLSYSSVATMIDVGYNAELVGRFIASCGDLPVFGIKGQGTSAASSGVREFAEMKTSSGERAYACWVDHYKNRWSASLKRSWNGIGLQPSPFFNAPIDATDKQLKELTVEIKREKVVKTTGQRIGWEWHRPSGARNELWDLLCYADCALEIYANEWSKAGRHLATNWTAFYDHLIAEAA